MKDRKSFPSCAAALAACLLTCQLAAAQPAADDPQRTAARQLGADGIAAYLANDFTTADQKLERAYKMVAAPTLAFWSARARRQLGHWLEAVQRYQEAVGLPDAVGDKTTQADARRDAQTELTALQSRIPTIRLQLSGATPQATSVSIDGTSVPSQNVVERVLPLNPGNHAILVQHGKDRRELRVQLAEREQKQLSVVFEPPKPEAALQIGASTTPSAAAHGPVLAEAGAVEAEPRPWRTVGIAAVSVGGAALVASGIAWLVASSQRDKCPNNTCQTVGDLSAYNSARTVSIVSFYTGAALALGGATTWAIATRKPVQEQTHVTLNVGPTSVTVHGSF